MTANRIFELRKRGELDSALDLFLKDAPRGYPAVPVRQSDDKWFAIAGLNVIVDLIRRDALDPDRVSYLRELLRGLDLSCDEGNLRRQQAAMNDGYSSGSSAHRFDGDIAVADQSAQQSGRQYIPRQPSDTSSGRIYSGAEHDPLRDDSFCQMPQGADALLAEARRLPLDGSHQRALDLLVQYRKITGDFSQDLAIAWRCYRRITELLKLQPVNVLAVKKLLNFYFKLKISDRTRIHRCMLTAAVKLARDTDAGRAGGGGQNFDFAAYLKLWDPNLISEDYWVREGDGRYPSLAEKALSIAAKEISHNSAAPDEILEFYLPFIRNLHERVPSDIWSRLYLSRILARLGRQEEASEMFVPLLKEKSDASWAWSTMASIYEKNSPNLACICYARALLCRDPESYKVNIHKSFAEFLRKTGDLSHARAEYQIYFSGKSRLTPADTAVENEEWFTSVQVADNQQEFYRSAAEPSEDLLYKDLEKLTAVTGSEYAVLDRKTKKKRRMRRFFIKRDFSGDLSEPDKLPETVPAMSSEEIEFLKKSMLQEISVPVSRINCSELKTGQTVILRGFEDSDRGFVIKSVSCSAEQKTVEQDEIFSSVTAFVDRINREKNTMHIYLCRSCSFFVRLDSVDIEVPNPPFGIRVVPSYFQLANGNVKFSVAKFIETVGLETLPSYLVRPYSGRLRIDDRGFGLAENTFVPAYIIKAGSLSDGMKIDGFAGISFDRTREKWSYSAITARAAQ